MADARSGSCSSTAKRVSRDRSRSDSSCTTASVVTRPFQLIFAGRNLPQLRLDLRQPSMDVTDAGFFVRISEFHIDQLEHPPNMFEDATFRGLDRVGNYLGEIIIAEIGGTHSRCGPVDYEILAFDEDEPPQFIEQREIMRCIARARKQAAEAINASGLLSARREWPCCRAAEQR